MIGQARLVGELMSMTGPDAPKTVMLVGGHGCGKHTLAGEFAERVGLPISDLTETVSFETLQEAAMNPLPTMYLIDVDKLTEQKQNAVLKFIEEPPANARVMLLSSDEGSVLPTVLNRCFRMRFDDYSREELSEIVGGDVADGVMSVCSTPGQVRMVSGYYDKLVGYCSGFAGKMEKAAKADSFASALRIADRINYRDEYDKFDLNVFIKVLKRELLSEYLAGNGAALELYNIVRDESSKLSDGRLNKKAFTQHMITLMWKKVKGGLT